MNKLIQLSAECDDIERDLIRDMIHSDANYVRAVVIMETAASNIAGLDADEAREAKESTDRSRSVAHDAFISSINIVNRICDAHGVPRIYTGGEARRAYGDFALELVSEIFSNRT